MAHMCLQTTHHLFSIVLCCAHVCWWIYRLATLYYVCTREGGRETHFVYCMLLKSKMYVFVSCIPAVHSALSNYSLIIGLLQTISVIINYCSYCWAYNYTCVSMHVHASVVAHPSHGRGGSNCTVCRISQYAMTVLLHHLLVYLIKYNLVYSALGIDSELF